MLFNLEKDLGNEILAYLVIDNFTSIPEVIVRGGGLETKVEANETRKALVTAGRHETGRCGFRLKVATTPQLGFPDLELREAQSGVLIYRRRPPGAIDRKIVRLETHLLPLWRFDNTIGQHFQYAMPRIDQYGRETITQMLLLSNLKSQYLSGQILFKNFEYFIGDSYALWICIQPPYEELAERLLLLRSARKLGTNFLSERERISFLPVMEFAEDLPVEDPKALKRALRAMPGDIAAQLSNPLTRQLTTSSPDQMPSTGALAAALDVLARCELVGFRNRFDEFSVAVARLLDIPPETVETAPTFSRIQNFAKMLEDSKVAEALIEKDIELYYHVARAHAAVEADEQQ